MQGAMTAAAATSAYNWLNTFDPTDPSTLASLLNTNISDPSTSDVPAGFDVLQPTTPVVVPSLSTYQQALQAFQIQADTYLVQSALGGSADGLLSGTTSSSSDLSSALQAAATAQQEQQQTQQQSALTAAQNALNTAQGIDTTA
jgi:hypothetical protein